MSNELVPEEGSGLEITVTAYNQSGAVEFVEPGDDDDLVEELSAYDQAMVSEEQEQEGTFLTGGNTRDFLELSTEKGMDENVILNPAPVRDGEVLLDYLRKNLHKFESPYAYIGGEANSPDQGRFHTAEIKILVARLSSYEAVSLSMTHSLMSQIYGELDYTFTDLAFMPKPKDYATLVEQGFPVWFGTNTKLAPNKFDVLSISHAVSMEQLNFVALLHDSGIPLFKQQRMQREDIPIIVVGGANSGTTAPLAGSWTDSKGNTYSCFVDAVIYGDGEEAGKAFIDIVRMGKQKGWSKSEILEYCHGRVEGFYEPDKYVHEYDGQGSITKIYPVDEKYEFPVRRATVRDLDSVRTMEAKILPYTGDGASVDVAIAGSVGCIGSAGWGACSFCREGSEGPYRERSVDKVMDALDRATRNQGTKEVSFFSLNFNMYTDLFPLVERSVKKGYKIGLISQRIDMLAETPEQVHVQRWLKKSNFTLGVEGISNRIRAFLNKNVQEWEILKVCREMMLGGAGELKFFYILTNMETEVDIQEHAAFMEKVNALREKLGAKTRFRLSFTPLFPSAFTALQFTPCLAAMKYGEKNLNPVFEKARELGWGRRLSVSGEEPLVSNTINHGGRNITPLLLASHFADGFRFYGNVPKGTWERWKRRVDADPNIDLDKMWGEKNFDYIFPWEDISYSTSKEVMYRGYLKAVSYQGIPYCITTPTIQGECHVNECGASLAQGTAVLTASGYRTIETLVQGDKVMTKSGLREVTHVWDRGPKDTVLVKTKMGYEVLASLDHPFDEYYQGSGGQFKSRGFRPLEKFAVGDLVKVIPGSLVTTEAELPAVEPAARNGISVSFPRYTNPQLGYLLGYFAGDGTVSEEARQVSFLIAEHERGDLESKIASFMEDQFGLSGSWKQDKPSVGRLTYSRVELVRFMLDHGVKDRVPELVWKASSETKAAYLRGLFDADGCMGNPEAKTTGSSVALSSARPVMIRDVQLLLLELGIYSKTYCAEKGLAIAGTDYVRQPANSLRIRGAYALQVFADKVGFTIGRKMDRLKVRLGQLGYETEFWGDETGAVDKIASITPVGTLPHWDIAVADVNHYTANGVVVHNCDPQKTGKPDPKIIKMIVGRKVAAPMSVKEIERIARSREKAYHLRVLAKVDDPMYRFVEKNYFLHALPRAFMRVSDKFTDAFVGPIGHARIGAGANGMRDWVYGQNIYDFSLCEVMSEQELKELIPLANAEFKEGTILDVRMDQHMTNLRNDVDFAVYDLFIPASEYSYRDLRDDVAKYFERKNMGRDNTIKVKKAFGKDIFKTVALKLSDQDIRQVDLAFHPDLRGSVMRMVVSARYNILSMLETITGRKSFRWKGIPVYCSGYIQLSEQTGEVDVFQALSGDVSYCQSCGGPLERDLFTGEINSHTCLSCDLDAFPLDTDVFFTKLLKAV